MVTINIDPGLAPPVMQLFIVGTNCSFDPETGEKEMLMNKTDELLFKLLPEIVPVLEDKKRAGPAQVSALFRDNVPLGRGDS